MTPRRGITWIELLVILVVLAITVTVLVPTIARTRTRNIDIRCASNLRQIGYALLLYSNDNRGHYPRTRMSAGPVRVPTWGTGVAATQPFSDPLGPVDNDVTAALFLLLRTQAITADVFVCPASTAAPDTFAGRTAAVRSNFTDVKKNLSYSYQNPYASDSMVPNSVSFMKYLGSISGEFAVAADINPGTTGGNSANHDARGQNVLYGDGHVTWANNAVAGYSRENIFTTKDAKIIASPFDVLDSILLPTDD